VNVQNRVIFPIYDREENLVSWQGRDITGTAYNKYFFPKGFNSSNYLFNYHKIAPNNYIVITEGIFDVLGWVKSGFYNVVCTFGKKISQKQMDDIIILNPRVVYMAWDSDADYAKRKFCERYQHLFHIRLIDLHGKDADELSTSELESSFNNAISYSQEVILMQQLKDPRFCQQMRQPLFQSDQ
jgi:DNA primase